LIPDTDSGSFRTVIPIHSGRLKTKILEPTAALVNLQSGNMVVLWLELIP
jgi:hypothetical protein